MFASLTLTRNFHLIHFLSRQNKLRLRDAILLFGALVSLVACSTFESPDSERQTWSKGGRPAYAMVEVTSKNGSTCDATANTGTATGCQAYGKVILTRPDSNVSYQFFTMDGQTITGVITCASPAEVARGLSVSGNVDIAASKDVSSATGISVSGSGAQTTAETMTSIAAQGAATQYIAAASFYNCLGFGSKMYDSTTAAGFQKDIFGQAVLVQQAASSTGAAAPAPKSGAAAPDAPGGTPKALAITGLPGYASVTFTAVADPAATYAVVSSTGDGTDTNKGTTLAVHFISGLTAGKPYTFTVTATNAGGTSKPSAASNSITSN
jgi:hypothetical protein